MSSVPLTPRRGMPLMRITRGPIACTLAALMTLQSCAGSLPGRVEVPVSQSRIPIETLWKTASLVATGRLSDIRRFGFSSRRADGITLYPCRGNFRVARPLKGSETLAGNPVLWYSYSTDCQTGPFLLQMNSEKERVWFLRIDGKWLRPIVDNSASYISFGEDLTTRSSFGINEFLAALVEDEVSAGVYTYPRSSRTAAACTLGAAEACPVRPQLEKSQ